MAELGPEEAERMGGHLEFLMRANAAQKAVDDLGAGKPVDRDKQAVVAAAWEAVWAFEQEPPSPYRRDDQAWEGNLNRQIAALRRVLEGLAPRG